MLIKTITPNTTYLIRSRSPRRAEQARPKRTAVEVFVRRWGSALVEVISHLPEYGLTRADERLLRRHGRDIIERLATPLSVAELGSGSGQETRHILEALCRRQRTAYYPIEISPSALAMCERELSDIESISILGFEREYLDGLLEVAAHRSPGQHLLVLFLGSTIGNFDRAAGTEFLTEVRHILQPGDSLLLGTDLEKSSVQLLAAYDDALGVTVSFQLESAGFASMRNSMPISISRSSEHVARINHEDPQRRNASPVHVPPDRARSRR